MHILSQKIFFHTLFRKKVLIPPVLAVNLWGTSIYQTEKKLHYVIGDHKHSKSIKENFSMVQKQQYL